MNGTIRRHWSEIQCTCADHDQECRPGTCQVSAQILLSDFLDHVHDGAALAFFVCHSASDLQGAWSICEHKELMASVLDAMGLWPQFAMRMVAAVRSDAPHSSFYTPAMIREAVPEIDLRLIARKPE